MWESGSHNYGVMCILTNTQDPKQYNQLFIFKMYVHPLISYGSSCFMKFLSER